MSLYQDFRPQTFSDVAGQDKTVEYLENLVKKSGSGEKIPHAYLFFGGHGIGKTTLARIFARDLGTNEADIYELDAASTSRKIDDTRELIESIYTLPILSKYKVYILDEAHQLTKDSSSALLKTLEEPPAHIIFILCTTNPEKLLSTVRSRCQSIELKKPSVDQLVNRLEYISKEKKFKIKSDALEIVARHSNNSYRDAVSNLESIVNTYDDYTKENINNYFGENEFDLEIRILKALVKKENSDSEIFDILTSVKSYDNFYKNILELLRIGLQSRFDSKLDLKNIDILKYDNKHEIFSDLIKDNQILFTSKNLLYFLEKSSLINKTNDKYTASIAIFSNFLEL